MVQWRLFNFRLLIVLSTSGFRPESVTGTVQDSGVAGAASDAGVAGAASDAGVAGAASGPGDRVRSRESFARKSGGIGSVVGLKTDNGLFEKGNNEFINGYRKGEKQCSMNDR